jgi:hypothetical protein
MWRMGASPPVLRILASLPVTGRLAPCRYRISKHVLYLDHKNTGIHCLHTSDIDNDGKGDLVINNFAPDKGLADPMVWFNVPQNPLLTRQWNRHVLADGNGPLNIHTLDYA